MPRLDSVLETSLYVDDLDRAARFDGEVLGLKALTSDQRFHAYDVGGRSVLLIFGRGFTLETVRMPGGTTTPNKAQTTSASAPNNSPTQITKPAVRLRTNRIAI